MNRTHRTERDACTTPENLKARIMKIGNTLETATNSYQISGILGQGGSGIVYRITDGNGDYAAKCLDPDKATGDKLKRFKNELRFCETNQHPNIIRVIDHGYVIEKGKKIPFNVMPLYQITLRGLMKVGINPDRVLALFSRVLDGVEAAHLMSVWHRDLKPENILSDQNGDSMVVADFGIAHFEEEELYTAVETKAADRLANFQYAAPEQRTRSGEVDSRADIFALGMMLNEMFTGQLLQGSGPKSIGSAAPEFSYLDEIVDWMVRQSPSERLARIDEIKSELRKKGNEFISAQKISELKKVVIPESEIDDPLILNPVRLTNPDYNGDTLFFELSSSVNNNWIECFQRIGSYHSVLGKGPQQFGWDNGRAVIQATEEEAPEIAKYFKEYVNSANAAYVELVNKKKQQREEHQRQNLKQQLEKEQRRQRVLQKIKL